ncbi:MAG: fasciclin domain-containing protein [Vampirovibrio sp.]|jgi:uncharacterized surface protein with fasciclin (FAS1) repeats
MLKKFLPLLAIVALATVSLPAFANDSVHHASSSHYTSSESGMVHSDIVGTALNNPNFSTLVTALKAAGLVEALQGPGPFTVFAPTNAAFNKLPAGTLESLLKPENKGKLQDILKYHVIQGNVMSTDIKSGTVAVGSLEGKSLAVQRTKGNAVKINESLVTMPDVKTSNGTIHAIDTVLLP